MRRGNAAKETGAEMPDEASPSAELSKLQRQLRVIENDQRTYAENAKNFLNKQQNEIGDLTKENIDIRTTLNIARSEKNEKIDVDDTQTLLNLIESLDYYNNCIKLEKMRVKDLDTEIRKVERKIMKQRMLTGSGSDETTTEMNKVQKTVNVMENRLNKAVVKFNNQLAVNARLRKGIDHLRQERSLFDKLYKKISKDLEETTKQMNDVVNKATVAYEERDEAQTKMIALKERSEKDVAQYESEMKDLKRIIHHDNKLKEFFNAKSNDRAEKKEEEEAKKRKNAKDKDTDADILHIRSFEEAFNQIIEVTGETNMETIVENFIKKENDNFALYNYVNELNEEVEQLQKDIDEMNKEIKRFEADGIKYEEERVKVLKELELRAERATKEADEGQERLVKINESLDKLKTGVQSLFDDIGCDSTPIDEMLGGDKGITNKNIMMYMGLIEKSTMEYLQKHEYNELMQNPPPPEKKDKKEEPLLPSAKTLCKVDIPSPVSINPPSVGEYEEIDILDDQSEPRPLNHEELKVVAQKNVNRRINTTPNT